MRKRKEAGNWMPLALKARLLALLALALAAFAFLEFAGLQRRQSARLLRARLAWDAAMLPEEGEVKEISSAAGLLYALRGPASGRGWRVELRRGMERLAEFKAGKEPLPSAIAASERGLYLALPGLGIAWLDAGLKGPLTLLEGGPKGQVLDMALDHGRRICCLLQGERRIAGLALLGKALFPASAGLSRVDAGGCWSLAFGMNGILALAGPGEKGLRCRVFGPDGGPLADFEPGVEAAPQHRVRADGAGRLFFNESVVGRGLAAWDLKGRYLGKVSFASHRIFDKQYLIAADPSQKGFSVLGEGFLAGVEP